MGNFSLGLNLVKQSASWVKACGKKSILETSPQVFHGINPTLALQNGKKIYLPRFISEEMKTARQMNKIAIQELKRPVDRTFSKATAEDFKRLTDTSFEMSGQRTVYTNPRDGKIYYLLSEGKTDKGLAKIRILDADGAYIKTVEVKPQKIVILDDFTSKSPLSATCNNQYQELSHGDMVQLVAKRTNPFANIEIIDIAKDKSRDGYLNLYDELEHLQERIDKGEKIDFLSLSIARAFSKENAKESLKVINTDPLTAKTTDILNNNELYEKFPLGMFASKNKGKIRVIQGAGNGGKDSLNADLSYPDIEGVGALNPFTKKIANFSASRNSLYTQHYEQGLFPYIPTSSGLSISGGVSTDIPLKPEFSKLAQKYLDKKPLVATNEEHILISKLKKSCVNEYETKYQELYDKLVTPDEKRALKEIYEKSRIEARQKSGNKYKNQYNNLVQQLRKRVLNEMKNVPITSLKEYQDAVTKLVQEGKVLRNGFSREYCIPNKNPFSYIKAMEFDQNKTGELKLAIPHSDNGSLSGTSFSTPKRAAKLALDKMLENVL